MGYAPLGITPRMKQYLKYMERYLVLSAYTIKGYIAAITFQGGITVEIFEEFLEFHLLPLCNSYPGPQSVLVMDNCGIHRNQRVLNLCAEKGVLIEYLPPYLPNFNPIKESFYDLKLWIRRNYYKLKDEYPMF